MIIRAKLDDGTKRVIDQVKRLEYQLEAQKKQASIKVNKIFVIAVSVMIGILMPIV